MRRLSLEGVNGSAQRTSEDGITKRSAALQCTPNANKNSAARLLAFAAAGLLLCIAYGLQVFFCADSALLYLPYVFDVSDMHANLLWIKSILEQGWLNPRPHHPYVNWMQAMGTYPEWISWWGHEAIYQQSPLYAYLLATFHLFTSDLLYIHIFQALLAVSMCGALGRIAFRLDDRPLTGWIAFAIAGAYAPFYAYSSALVRDLIGWTITAWLLVVLLELARHSAAGSKARHSLLAGAAGLLLGLGLLSRETYVLTVPVVSGILLWRFVRIKAFSTVAVFAAMLALVVAPLVVRNCVVGAPLLSTSNRFGEAFIQGNARSAHPYLFTIADETTQILDTSRGRAFPLIRETLRTHPSCTHWVRLQISKMLSLMDPFESYDNLNMGFAETISPLVKWGLKHWMIITPGLGGLLLSCLRRDRRHFWLWVLLPMLLAGVIVGTPFSRYRQLLAVLWIPWAAYLLVNLFSRHTLFPTRWTTDFSTPLANNGFRAGLVAFVVAGWLLSLGPLARAPKEFYDRPYEYQLSLDIYRKLGKTEKAAEIVQVLRSKFTDEQLAGKGGWSIINPAAQRPARFGENPSR